MRCRGCRISRAVGLSRLRTRQIRSYAPPGSAVLTLPTPSAANPELSARPGLERSSFGVIACSGRVSRRSTLRIWSYPCRALQIRSYRPPQAPVTPNLQRSPFVTPDLQRWVRRDAAGNSIPAASAEHNSISAAPGTGALTAAPDLPNSVTGGARSAAPGDANLQTSRAWLPVAPGHAPAHGGRTRAVMPSPLGRMGKDRHRFRRRASITHPSTAYA